MSVPTSIFLRHFKNCFPSEIGTSEYDTYTTSISGNETMLDYVRNVFDRMGDTTYDDINIVENM